jgi:Leucine-rich repeat (LRR) protein
MKKLSLLTVISMLVLATAISFGIVIFPGRTASAAEGDVELNSTNFPDDEFRKNLKHLMVFYDDGVMTPEEVKTVKSITMSSEGIKNLKGIEFFTSLEKLDCSNNKLTSLDVSNNTNLKELNCSDNKLTNLDLKYNPELTKLDCSTNKGLELDVSNNNALVYLDCFGIFADFDVSNLTALEYLNCNYTDITSLNIGNNKALKELHCMNNGLTGIELSNNTALESLYLTGNNLSELDVSKNTALKFLECSSNKLKELDVSNNTALIDLGCISNNIHTLDLSNNTKLKGLIILYNYIPEIDLSKNTALETLFCARCGMKSLDLSKNTNLKQLWCSSNWLESLDLSMNPLLDDLSCDENKYTEIYLAKEPDSFTKFTCEDEVKKIVLTPSDWKYNGVKWVVDNTDSSQTTATAQFECTKEGVKDYKISEPMTVKVDIINDCVNEGSINYAATLPAKYSRTGKKISEKKSFKIPAAGHKWSSWKVSTKSSTGVPGVETRTCSACKKQEKRNTGSASVICGKNITLKETMNWLSSDVTWKSSNTKTAAVDSKGKITAKMAGTVTITATAAGKSVKCTVTVLYKDVISSSDFWYEPTNYLTAKGVVKGYANQTEFRPANDCTRAQMITFLYRLQGEPKTKSSTCKFSDVKSGDYFYKPVIWAEEQGITTVPKDKKFNPQGVCTRAQTVTFLWRMAGKPEPGKNAKTFSDVKKTDYFYKATLWASGKKILAGYDDNTFRPQGKCLRRQMVTFLYKYDKYVNDK